MLHFAFAAGSPKPAGKEAELKQVRSRIESIRKAIHRDSEKRDALSGQLKDADLQIQGARERLTAVRTERQASERKLRDLEQERAEAEAQVVAERDTLARELRSAYINGPEEPLKLLLNQQDPAELGRMSEYYAYFSRARAERIATIGDHVAHLDLLRESIAKETERLRALEASSEQQATTLAHARDRREQALEAIQSRIQSRGDELTQLQRDAAALERLVEELRRAMQEFPLLGRQPFERTKGKLPWPTRGELLARFGQLRSGGPLKWQGIVIGTERGAPIRAPLNGRVIYADWLPGLGLLVVLDHGGGYMSLYGHGEQLYKKVGDSVDAGDVIAAAGDAGINGRSGLYLEIRRGKQALNPLEWLSKQ
jgi:septal ring factor EnvC (AmiA/AmiB activator)